MATGEQTMEQSTGHKLIFGSRKSKLAMWQTHHVAEKLVAANPNVQVVIREFSTIGDRQTLQPLPKIGGKGLFTAELDRAIQTGEIDLAIHSLKDLPTTPTQDLVVQPLLEREDPRDVLISKYDQKLADLKPGATVGTSSYRRQSQLLSLRPDLNIRSIRGNVPTRIAKAETPEFDAVILAAAGVLRLGMENRIADWLPISDMLPAPGQASVAATFRENNSGVSALLNPLIDPLCLQFVNAERTFLAAMGGGCSSPIAAYACHSETTPDAISLTGRLSSLDGKSVITHELTGANGTLLAKELAKTILENGGQEILDSLPTPNSH